MNQVPSMHSSSLPAARSGAQQAGDPRSPVSRRALMPLHFLFALLLATLGSVVATPTAHAQQQEVTSYDFEDDLVTGDLVRPDGEMLTVRKGGRRSSLIQIRENFVPELLLTVEDL